MCGIALILSGARILVESHLHLYRGEHSAGGAQPPTSNSNSNSQEVSIISLFLFSYVNTLGRNCSSSQACW